jgi:hypothetical protein
MRVVSWTALTLLVAGTGCGGDDLSRDMVTSRITGDVTGQRREQ